MELSRMEKRMLYQTEGCDRYAVLNELSMASRYAGDPVRRRAAKSLMEKLSPLTEEKCMEIVKDIQKNYQLPREGRTVGVLIAEARQKSSVEKLKGHDIMALERFDPEVRHMVVFDMLSVDSLSVTKGTGCASSLRSKDTFRDSEERRDKDTEPCKGHAGRVSAL